MLMIIAILIWALYSIYFNLKTARVVRYSEQFPGPKAHKIFGNIFNFTFEDPLVAKQQIVRCHEQFGSIFRITLIRDYQFMIADPKIYEVILSSTTHYLRKNVLYDFLKPFLRNGLVVSTGQYWHNHRKIITPAFHFKILEQFVDIFDLQSRIMVEKLAKHCDGSVIDIVEHIKPLTLDIISETAMGTTINAQKDSDSDYAKAIDEIKHSVSIRFSSRWKRFDILFATLGYKDKLVHDKCIKISRDFTNDIIIKRRNYLLNNNDDITGIASHTAESNDRVSQSKKMVFLDILLQANVDGKPLTNDEIAEEVETFMFAGYDTSTAGISSVLHALSRNKPVQDKLFDEIIGIIGTDKNAPVTYRQVQSLKYMDAVIKESFRLYPPVTAVGRYIDRDIKLDDGRIIPAGVNVTLNLSVTMKDPKYFKNPLEFNPERFTSDNPDQIDPFVYIPFSAGPRNCIGQKYALLDIKVVVVQVLRHYELLPKGEEPIFTSEIVSQSINGMQMALAPRVP